MGHPAYRGRQVSEWVYGKSARSVDEMTTLPAALRGQLGSEAEHPLMRAVQESASDDGTIKFLVEAGDGNRVECVYLPFEDRVTLCLSTQVGCAMDCSFCATAIGGLTRNLTAGEIVDQVLLAQARTGTRITNVVYMGMGEPLANYAEVVKSIRLLTGEVGMSARRVTVSTVGLAPAIERLADEGLPITLAVSLHAPDDGLRRQIMPAAKLYPMDALMESCRLWTEKTGRRMTFEYLLLQGVNDAPEHAVELARRVRPMLANVNIIPYNHVEGRGSFSRPGRDRIQAFRETLEQQGVVVTERMRKGNPIDAACGQLRHEAEKGRKISSATTGPGS